MFNGQSAFLYSIHCQCSMEIQKVLIEYEEDMNECFGNLTTVFWAIFYESPLILDIIERGGDINNFSEETNIISFALWSNCDSDIFKVLWDKFDYNVWKQSFSKCVLVLFLLELSDQSNEWRKSIMTVLLENEDKLKLDIEHHNNSYFYESDSIISDVFLACVGMNLPFDTVSSYIIHLLSYGALIFKSDIDSIYYNSPKDPTSLINELFFMELRKSQDSDESFSPMYFKYTLQPSVREYLSNCQISLTNRVDIKFLKRLKHYFYFNTEIKTIILELDTSEDNIFEILYGCHEFPSLLELSRNSARHFLCFKYKIHNVGMFYTILNRMDFPNYVKELLTYQKQIYRILKLDCAVA